jgi:two-component system, response regulator PdtaR
VEVKVALRTTLLLVDDDIQQLEMRALVMKMSGFTVLTATSAIEAISIASQHNGTTIDVAVIDYDMPVINGCDLAHYLRGRYPSIKIILHSGASDIPECEMGSVDVFVPKADSIARLVEEASTYRRPQNFGGRSAGMPESL